MTVVLLVGAALLGRSLLRVLSVDPGFRTDGIVAMDLAHAVLGRSERDREARPRSIPICSIACARSPASTKSPRPTRCRSTAACPTACSPCCRRRTRPRRWKTSRPLFQQKDKLGTADFCAASPAYFRALGIPLVRGRLFDDRDGPNAPHVAVISESLARARWPNVGSDRRNGRIRQHGRRSPPAHDRRHRRRHTRVRTRAAASADALRQSDAAAQFSSTVVMRSDADPAAVTTAARERRCEQIAPDVPPRFRTFAQIYSTSLGARHFNLTLVAVFAGTALVLAIAGIYGVMTYSVTQRRRRLASGSRSARSPGQVLRIILGQGSTTTAIGVATRHRRGARSDPHDREPAVRSHTDRSGHICTRSSWCWPASPRSRVTCRRAAPPTPIRWKRSGRSIRQSLIADHSS